MKLCSVQVEKVSNKNHSGKFQRVINYLWGLVRGSLVVHIRVFHIRTEMPILAFSSLLHENKKNPVTKCYPEWQ